MKKYWRIRNDADIELCLHKLNVGSDYIKILLEEDSDFMKYLNTKAEYVYITYKLEKHQDIHNYFCWMEDEGLGLLHNWKFCGDINLRKEKLKKINGRF